MDTCVVLVDNFKNPLFPLPAYAIVFIDNVCVHEEEPKDYLIHSLKGLILREEFAYITSVLVPFQFQLL